MPLRSRRSRVTPSRLVANAAGAAVVVPMYYGAAHGQAYGYAIAGVLLIVGIVLLVLLVRSRRQLAKWSAGA